MFDWLWNWLVEWSVWKVISTAFLWVMLVPIHKVGTGLKDYFHYSKELKYGRDSLASVGISWEQAMNSNNDLKENYELMGSLKTKGLIWVFVGFIAIAVWLFFSVAWWHYMIPFLLAGAGYIFHQPD